MEQTLILQPIQSFRTAFGRAGLSVTFIRRAPVNVRVGSFASKAIRAGRRSKSAVPPKADLNSSFVSPADGLLTNHRTPSPRYHAGNRGCDRRLIRSARAETGAEIMWLASAPHCSGTGVPPAYLCFRRGARGHAGLAYLYYTFGTPLLWRRYHQILGPRCQLPKFANGVCRYSEIFVCLDSHLIWQAAKSNVERGSAFGLVSH
jgi:hypothetical protein